MVPHNYPTLSVEILQQYESDSQVIAANHKAGQTHLLIKMQIGTRRTAEFDSVAFTILARQVSLLNLYPRLEYAKKYALDSFHYMTSVKVFLSFSSTFWASSTNNNQEGGVE